MYWYKIKPYLFIILCTSGLHACKPDVVVSDGQYFDVKGYFSGEVLRLSNKPPHIKKTVNHNTDAETREVVINTWKDELGLFSGSDINKPAWRNSYTVIKKGGLTRYIAKSPELKTRQVSVLTDHNKVKSVIIINQTSNILYTSTEKLTYCPDSVYTIDKTQRVRLMGTNTYKIKGVFD